jgi:hypothetical protein
MISGKVIYSNGRYESQADFINRLLKVGALKVMLLNAAIHPQYSGQKLGDTKDNPFLNSSLSKESIFRYKPIEKDFKSLRSQAENLGCSITNPGLFYIDHIYCDNLKRQRIFFDTPVIRSAKRINTTPIFEKIFALKNFLYKVYSYCVGPKQIIYPLESLK